MMKSNLLWVSMAAVCVLVGRSLDSFHPPRTLYLSHQSTLHLVPEVEQHGDHLQCPSVNRRQVLQAPHHSSSVYLPSKCNFTHCLTTGHRLLGYLPVTELSHHCRGSVFLEFGNLTISLFCAQSCLKQSCSTLSHWQAAIYRFRRDWHIPWQGP